MLQTALYKQNYVVFLSSKRGGFDHRTPLGVRHWVGAFMQRQTCFSFSEPNWSKILKYCALDFSGVTCKLSDGDLEVT